MSSLAKRIVSAAVLMPVTVAALWFGGWAFYALMVAVFAISLQEWSRLSLRGGRVSWALLGAGVVYLTLACLCAVWLRDHDNAGFFLLMYVLLAVWACDIGAYATGKTLGGPKMAPSISPNKTWSGLIGGCVFAALALVAYDACLAWRGVAVPVIEGFGYVCLVALGAALAVVGQIGDLMISALKRKCGLKDTGNIIPGHGGLLDRIDALLLAIPVYAIIVVVIGYMGAS